MSEQSALRLRDLLPSSIKLETKVQAELRKDQRIGAMTLAWNVIESAAGTEVKGALDLDVFETLAQGWCLAEKLREFNDPTKHPKGETAVITLGEHEFLRELYPTLEVTIGPSTLPLRFACKLKATIHTFALTIRDGCIMSVGAGDGEVSAQLSYGDVDLTEWRSTKVTLPGSITFRDPGLKIG